MSVTMSDTKNNEKAWHIPFSASIGGAMGGYLCFPFESLKKKAQSGQGITKNSFHPRELYRGSSSFAASVTVATLASMSFRYALQSLPAYDSTSQAWGAATALCGGVLGATVGSTPVENIILTQQLNRTGPINALQILFKQGVTRPWVGLPELAIREAGFAGVMLWGGTAASHEVNKLTGSSALATTAEICADMFGAVITQPFDTMATIRQKHNGSLSSLQALKLIVRKNGYKGLFKGLSNRIFLFTGCALVIPRIETAIRGVLNKMN